MKTPVISFQDKPKFDQQATLILVTKKALERPSLLDLPKDLETILKDLSASERFSADKGETFPVVYRKTLVVFAGLGDDKKLSSTALRVYTRWALQSLHVKKLERIEIIASDDKEETLKLVAEAVLLGLYAWDKYKTSNGKPAAKKVFVIGRKTSSIENVLTVCAGVDLARDLVNDNADIITSEYFEKALHDVIKGRKNISLEVLNRKEMTAKGLGLHLAVNQGSKKEPKLIIVQYTGNPKAKNYTALIGKGVTFDTGGLNIKPSGGIETMRIDMGGAAAVLGTLQNVLNLQLKTNVLFAFALAENVVDAFSYKPGDVITGYSGKTVEVGNTDAEGRLVLADALSYLIKNYKPDTMIDIATLTGAVVVALGHDYTGLMANDDYLADKLIAAAQATDDRAWKLPLYQELKDSMKSKIADIRNIATPRGAAGTITGAEFLRQFVEDNARWAHLDIAGTAFVENDQRWYFGHGATGAGVRLLTQYLKSL